LQDIFFSMRGTGVYDRFCKAMRTDSGLTYNPNVSFAQDPLYPNTNLAYVNMFFTSPQDKVGMAVELARETWFNFVNKGVTQEEWDCVRISLMNKLQADSNEFFSECLDMFFSFQQGRMNSPLRKELIIRALNTQKDAKSANEFLQRIWNSGPMPVLVGLGNPSLESIEQLTKNPAYEFLEAEELESIRAEWKKGL
jgi:hypothetical protein